METYQLNPMTKSISEATNCEIGVGFGCCVLCSRERATKLECHQHRKSRNLAPIIKYVTCTVSVNICHRYTHPYQSVRPIATKYGHKYDIQLHPSVPSKSDAFEQMLHFDQAV